MKKTNRNLVSVVIVLAASLSAPVFAAPEDVVAEKQSCTFFLGKDAATVKAIAEAKGAEAFGIKIGLNVRKSKSAALVVGYKHGYADANDKPIQNVTVADTRAALEVYCAKNIDKSLFDAAKAI